MRWVDDKEDIESEEVAEDGETTEDPNVEKDTEATGI